MTHEHILADTLTLLMGDDTTSVGYSIPSKQIYIGDQSSTSIKPFSVRRLPNGHSIVLTPKPDVKNISPMSSMFGSIVCSPTEQKAYVTFADGSTLFLDTKTNSAYPSRLPKRVNPITNLAFSPDGKMSYFPANDGIIYALDETSDAPPISIPLSIIDVQWVAVTQDGAYAYAGGIYASALSRVDLNKMQEKDTLPLPEPVYSFDVCNDGSKLFVSLETQVVIVDIAQNKVKGSIPYPEYRPKSFGQLSCSKTAPRACLSVASNQLVAVIDTATDSKLGTIPTPPSPFTTAFDEYGDSYIATQNGTLAIHYSVLEAMGPA